MKITGVIFFSWCLILGEALAIEPVGTIGKAPFRKLSFLPDGNMIRVMPKHIEIVDPDNDVVIAAFAESSEFLGLVIVSPDGGQLVNRRREMVELWDINGREKLGEWEFASLGSWVAGVLDYPSRVAFGRTQSLLAINGRTDEIFLLDWKAGEWVGRLEDNRRPIRECYSRSGSNWSGSWGSSRCNDRPPFVLSMAFSPDARFLVVGSKRSDAEIWDLETRKLTGHLEGHEDWVTKVAYSHDGQWIATTEVASTKVYLWNAGTRQLVRTLRNGDRGAYNEGEVFDLFFSRDSRRL
jgi:WD40 repeat protein